jgi:endoglucanase
VDQGIPVYLGETGCVHRSTETAENFRKYYLEYVYKAAHDYGLAPIYWDNGASGTGTECSGLFNRSTGAFLNNGKDIVAIMSYAVNNVEEDYTLTSVYNKAPQP